MAIAPDRINALLHNLAERFEAAVQELPHNPSHQGWGQFLDAPKLHEQVGVYGTSAGVIVLALAGRLQSNMAQKAVDTLSQWWNARDTDDYGRKRFPQTLRLALMHIAAHVSPAFAPKPAAAAVRTELLARLLPSHFWGDYWIDANNHDSTPRPFVTAVTLLSFTLFAEATTLIPELVDVANALERTFLGNDSRPHYEQLALAAAILSVKGPSTAPKALAKVAGIARAIPQDFADQAVYFYDYEHPAQKKNAPRYGRDYLVVSPEILLGVAGFQHGAPTSLRLRAEAVVEALILNCSAHNAFRPAPGERLSTMNQAWCAMLLHLALSAHDKPSKRGRLWYALVRTRSDNVFTRISFPLSAVSIVTIGTLLLNDAAFWQRCIGALGVLFITSIYGRRLLNKGLAPLIGERNDSV